MPTAGEPGGLLAGRFRVGELLGSGGSASVFAAQDVRSGAPVAVKVLHPHLAQRPAAREAFLAEADRARALRHPNIVSVIDGGVENDQAEPVAWIALQRAEGISLAEHVERHGALAVGSAVAVAEGLLRALGAVHAAGLVHRDVSPANVMIVADDAGAVRPEGVRLLDFGSSDAAGAPTLVADTVLSADATGRAGVLGNVNYLSPEQARGEPVDERGDLYQCGAVLYFALTGRPPFVRADTAQTMRAHVETPPPVPSVADRRIPRAVDRVVVRAMLKEPDDRFASAAEMSDALGEVERAASVPVPTGVAEHTTVTRVLGRTAVPPQAGRHADGAPVRSPHGRRTSRGAVVVGSWAVVAAAAVGLIAAATYAASTAPPTAVATPTAAASDVASATPSPTRTTTVPAPPPPTTAPSSVPELAMLTLEAARAALASAGYLVGEVVQIDAAHPAATVLRQSPAAGEALRSGGTVSLVVASGRNTVPDVAGFTLARAVSAIEGAGFEVVLGRAPGSGTPGTVLRTEPGGGASVRLHSTVTILEPVEPVEPVEPTPAPTATPFPTTVPTPGPSASPSAPVTP